MKKIIYLIISGLVLIFSFSLFYTIYLDAQSSEPEMPADNMNCMMCHSDETLTGTKNGRKISVFVNEKTYLNSVHKDNLCTDCHLDVNPDEIPHNDDLEKAVCFTCHADVAEDYDISFHGKAAKKGDPLAPDCQFCHGSHNVKYVKDKNSKVTPLDIPYLCGQCHQEGSEVQLKRNIPQTHIFENYSQSIHGEGLFEKGLTVTATCVSCHTAHKILPHTDNRSSISRSKIVGTCTTCHARIEDVHKKIIDGELWEKEPHKLPACFDCHQPHKIRKSQYNFGLTDNECNTCHADKNIVAQTGKQSMYVDKTHISQSVHKEVSCVECHVQATPTKKGRACATIETNVKCGSCHENINNTFLGSIHGKLHEDSDPDAPGCKTCHGDHLILSKKNPNSTIFPVNIPELCSKCHQTGMKAEQRIKNGDSAIVDKYIESIHGKGLSEQGMTVTATCSDCHTAHNINEIENPNSSVNPANIGETCGSCHWGIQQDFKKSIHSKEVSNSKEPLPTCEDCHTSHAITDPTKDEFRTSIISTCGQCHEKLSHSYFDTYHGKASNLGSAKAAKCHDCHTAHKILPSDMKGSSLNLENIVQTCSQCHPNANIGFTRYLTHATHHDPDKFPLLFYTFWFMASLLIGTFIISWIHTLLWLPKSLKMRKQIKAMKKEGHSGIRIKRFTATQRVLHVLMVTSFLILALTGMIVKFSNVGWAQFAVTLIGGVESAGYLHRFAATLLFFVFFYHIYDLIKLKKKAYSSWKELIFGRDSMLLNRKDLHDFIGTMKWFFGKGPRPDYGRWTYWEKFDYFAVFWGIFVIGFTGLTLWFPSFFTMFIPGEFINVATIIHSDEALLAAGFIFSIHFFNTHFRPEKFPMDTVIFTGSYHLEEFKFDRPEEYNKLVEDGTLEEYYANEPTKPIKTFSKVFGWSALIIGLIIVTMIVISLINSFIS